MKAFIVLFAIILFGVASCSQKSPTIVFLIPKDFIGLILISEDKELGQTLRRNSSGEYVIEVPPDGHAKIKSFKLLDAWHKEKVICQDGRSLNVESNNSDQAKAFFSLPYIQGRGCFYFVGTRAEYEHVSKRTDLDTLPLGKAIQDKQ